MASRTGSIGAQPNPPFSLAARAFQTLPPPSLPAPRWRRASVQRARVAAVKAFSHSVEMDDEETKLALARDALIATLLTTMPPDRVGIARTLQLGQTLKRVVGGYDLDLSMPGAHKTRCA